MSTITITHTHEDGTLLHGSSKGDGVFEIVKRHRFAFFPSIRAIGIRQSRDQVAKRYQIHAAAEALRAAGHEVTVDIDDTPRDRGTVLTDQGERLDDRADRLEARAARHARAADAAYSRADEIAGRFEGGQPIILGHHSTRKALRDREKMHAAHERGRGEQQVAEAIEYAASRVGRDAAYRERPGVTARRIRTTESELRVIARDLEGWTGRHLRHDGTPYAIDVHQPVSGTHRDVLLARQALLTERLAYDQAQLAAAREAGTYRPADRDSVHVGDLVKYSGWTGPVLKINRITVTAHVGETWKPKIPFAEVVVVHCPHNQPAGEPQPMEPGPMTGPETERHERMAAGLAAVEQEATDTAVRLGITFPEPTVRSHQLVGQGATVEAKPDRAARIAAALAAPMVHAVAYFPTPAELAARIIREHTNLDTAVAPRVLEPSAGDGALVRAVLAANDQAHVTAIEPNVTLVGLISRGQSLDRLSVFCSTFEEYGTGDHPELFDLVVMNPPFSEPGRPMLWAEHVLAAFELVAPGGRLVAIVPASVDYGQAKKAAAVRDLATENSGGWEALPDRSFAAVGTTARTYVVWMDRPAAVVAVLEPDPVGPVVYAQVGLFESEAV